ncbi:fatty acid desaturase, partial [Candidatus Pacearchaeota archaeon]|nr:fatty acid desaturase [Candidatus Pacearchaeota archaeon]
MKKMNLNSSFEIFNKKRMNLSNHDYIELKKELEVSGLLKKTLLYYLSNFLVNALLLISLFSIILYFNMWHITILASIPIAFVFMQFAYLGHDAGHRAISKSRFTNAFVGHFTHSFLLGGSFSYWRFKHNNHHAYPNHETFDPDLNNAPFSLSERQAKQRTGFSNLITRFQSFLLPPVFLVMLFLMRWDSV